MAAITHGSATQYAAVTHTGDSSWSTALTAPKAGFTGSAKYLMFFRASISGTTTTHNYSVRFAHGATPTVLASFETRPRGVASADTQEVSWMEVFTQPATADDVVVQIKTANSGETVTARGIGIYWVQIDEVSTDFFKSVLDTTGGDIGNTTSGYTEHGTLTWTPTDVADVWLVMSATQVLHQITGGWKVAGRLSRDTETETVSAWLREPWEDTAHDYALTLWYGSLTAASHTFETQLEDATAAPATPTQHVRTVTVALNLTQAFSDFAHSYTGSAVTLGTNTELESVSVTPSALQDGFVFVFADNDVGNQPSSTRMRIQNDGTTITPDLYSYDASISKEATDKYQLSQFRYGSFTAAAHTIDWDGTNVGGTSPQVGAGAGRRIVFMGLEVPSAGSTVVLSAVSVGLSVPVAVSGFGTVQRLSAVTVTLAPQSGYSELGSTMYRPVFRVNMTEPGFSSSVDSPVKVSAVSVAVSVLPRFAGFTPFVVAPVVVSAAPAGDRQWVSVQTITAREHGYFARDAAEPVLTLVYGARRSLPVGWSSGEGWQIVSQRFMFNGTAEGRAELDRAVEGAWATHRLSSQSVLAGAMNQALQNAGFRRPDGSDLGSSTTVRL